MQGSQTSENRYKSQVICVKSNKITPDDAKISGTQGVKFSEESKCNIFQVFLLVLRVLTHLRYILSSGIAQQRHCDFKLKQEHELQQLKYTQSMEKPLSYNKISIQKRKQLVELVIVNKHSIAKASKTLQIKNSTAKLIVKRYRQTGTFFQPKKQRTLEIPHERDLSESASNVQLNNFQNQDQQIVPFYQNSTPFFFCFGQNVEISNFEQQCSWQNYLPILSGLHYMF